MDKGSFVSKNKIVTAFQKSVAKSVESELDNESDLKRRLLLVLSAGDVKAVGFQAHFLF